jgi:hypothetical protein
VLTQTPTAERTALLDGPEVFCGAVAVRTHEDDILGARNV